MGFARLVISQLDGVNTPNADTPNGPGPNERGEHPESINRGSTMPGSCGLLSHFLCKDFHPHLGTMRSLTMQTSQVSPPDFEASQVATVRFPRTIP